MVESKTQTLLGMLIARDDGTFFVKLTNGSRFPVNVSTDPGLKTSGGLSAAAGQSFPNRARVEVDLPADLTAVRRVDAQDVRVVEVLEAGNPDTIAKVVPVNPAQLKDLRRLVMA